MSYVCFPSGILPFSHSPLSMELFQRDWLFIQFSLGDLGFELDLPTPYMCKWVAITLYGLVLITLHVRVSQGSNPLTRMLKIKKQSCFKKILKKSWYYFWCKNSNLFSFKKYISYSPLPQSHSKVIMTLILSTHPYTNRHAEGKTIILYDWVFLTSFHVILWTYVG